MTNASTVPQGNDLIADQDGYWEGASRENIEIFLDAVSTPEWLKHVNEFDLEAELEFVERFDLDHTLLSGDFSFPLGELGDPGEFEIAERYKKLLPGGFLALNAERFVHLRCREIVRDRLQLTPMTEHDVLAFFSAGPPKLQPHEFRLTSKGRKCHPDDLTAAIAVMHEFYPTVVAYLRAAGSISGDFRCASGRMGRVGAAASGFVKSVALSKVDPAVKDAEYELAWTISDS